MLKVVAISAPSERGELLLVDEHAELARLGEVGHGGQEGRALDAGVLLHRHVGEGGGEQRAAQAIADDVGIGLAGRRLDRVERGQRALQHVVLEGLAGELGVGVDPGDHEDGEALGHGPLDEGVLLAQIEDIVLVDPGRDDQQRPLVDLFGGRRVLDQLDQVVLVDHLARRHRDVLADLEGLGVGHPDLQPAVAPVQVVQQVPQPLDQVLAARLHGRAQHLGVGHDEVGRRHGVDELARVEIDLLGGLVVQALDLLNGGLDPARAQQIGLLDEVEDVVLVPGGVGKAPVVALGLERGFARTADQALRGGLPELHVVLPEVHLGLNQLGRVAHHARGHLKEGAADIERIEALGSPLGAGLPFEPVGHDLLALLGDLAHRLGELNGVGQFDVLALLLRHIGFLMFLNARFLGCNGPCTRRLPHCGATFRPSCCSAGGTPPGGHCQ
jgi:hypothetical protein